MLTGERPRPKRRDERVELAADPRHLRFRNPIQAEGLHQVIDLPRRHPVHVGFLDDHQQGVFRPPAGLQQRREVRPGPHLGNRQLDRAHARIPCARAVPSAVRRTIAGPLVPLGADQPGHFRLHQGLREHTNALAQHVPVLFLKELAHERRQIHSGLRHRVNFLVVGRFLSHPLDGTRYRSILLVIGMPAPIVAF